MRIVDINPDSPTFKDHVIVELDGQKRAVDELKEVLEDWAKSKGREIY